MPLRDHRVLRMMLALALVAGLSAVGAPAGADVSASGYYPPDAYEPLDDAPATAPVLPDISFHTIETTTSGDMWAKSDDVDWFRFSVDATGEPTVITGYATWGTPRRYDAAVYSMDASGALTELAVDTGGFGQTYTQFPYIYFEAPAPGTYYGCITGDWDTPGDYYLYLGHGDALRIAGANRYATALQASQFFWPDGNNPDAAGYPDGGVVVTSGKAWPDALAGAALLWDAPLLLTDGDRLRSDVKAEIERLMESGRYDSAEETVYVLGGTGVVSEAAFNEIRELEGVRNVIRLAGANRYATAAAIAEEARTEYGNRGEIFLCSGEGFADALGAGPLAQASRGQILLTRAAALPAETRGFLQGASYVTTVTVVGGTGAIADSVLAEVQDAIPGTQVIQRIAGANRYETARELAEYGVFGEHPHWIAPMSTSAVVLASGENFPDALTATGVSWNLNYAPILLTPSASLSQSVKDFAAIEGPGEPGYWAIGGPASISASAFEEFQQLWKVEE